MANAAGAVSADASVWALTSSALDPAGGRLPSAPGPDNCSVRAPRDEGRPFLPPATPCAAAPEGPLTERGPAPGCCCTEWMRRASAVQLCCPGGW